MEAEAFPNGRVPLHSRSTWTKSIIVQLSITNISTNLYIVINNTTILFLIVFCDKICLRESQPTRNTSKNMKIIVCLSASVCFPMLRTIWTFTKCTYCVIRLSSLLRYLLNYTTRQLQTHAPKHKHTHTYLHNIEWTDKMQIFIYIIYSDGNPLMKFHWDTEKFISQIMEPSWSTIVCLTGPVL